MHRNLLALILVLSLGACATVPESLRGEFAQGANLLAVRSQPDNFTGQEVRWGGIILNVDNQREESILEILAYPLDKSSRPKIDRMALGRFLLHSNQFLDPAIYPRDRELTVVGIIQGVEKRKIGEFEYPYPLIEGRVLYVWPEREEVGSYYDPWYPWYPWYMWDPWYGYPYPWYRHYHPRH
jgi:outer membrane lipoprotein